MHDDELSETERRALEALPRETRTPRALEDRVVVALRREGLLHAPAALRFPLSPAWIGAAAAACVALFAGGFALGGWMESRHTTEVLVRMHERDSANAAAAAAEVQRTGSAYVAALSTLAAFADTSRGESLAQGREVAVNALHAAANQMLRISPEDPLAAGILRGLDRSSSKDSLSATSPRRTVWF
jgi:hypothetical protein